MKDVYKLAEHPPTLRWKREEREQRFPPSSIDIPSRDENRTFLHLSFPAINLSLPSHLSQLGRRRRSEVQNSRRQLFTLFPHRFVSVSYSLPRLP